MPPILFDAAVRVRGRTRGVGFFGDYGSFSEALRDCRGDDYESASILKWTRDQTRVAMDNSVTHIPPPLMPYLLTMLHAALALNKDRLDVMDFGGALGANYFHFRRLLPRRIALRWTIVELPATVAAGAEFATDELHFTEDSTLAAGSVDIVFSSCALHYMPNPHEKFRELLSIGAPHHIFALMPLRDALRDRLTVQRVGPHIASISNPHWFLAKQPFLATISDLRTASTWRHPEYTNYPDGDPKPCEYFGFHFVQ